MVRVLAVVLLCLPLVAGCKKKTPPASAAATPAAPAPVAGGANDTNYQAGAGAVQNVRNAARRTVAINDMNQIGLTIETLYSTSGRMPDINAIKAELRTAGNLLALISDGAVILTGTTNHSGLWAYQADADTQGGIGLVAGRAARMSADEIKNTPR